MDLTQQLEWSSGPNPLWCAQQLEASGRVLDVGCGHGISSVHFAENGCEVWALDQAVNPNGLDRYARDSGLSIYALKGDARRLPFPSAFFDAAVSVNAWNYIATDMRPLEGLAKVVKPGGTIQMALTGLTSELQQAPDHWTDLMKQALPVLHSAAWWRSEWSRVASLTNVDVQEIDDAPKHWVEWYDLMVEHKIVPAKLNAAEARMLHADAGRALTVLRLRARVV